MRKVFFSFLLLTIFFSAYSQYWFGPKVGTHLVSHRYQLKDYKSDSFKINPDVRWQVGFVLTYSASERYSVHTEINFERIQRVFKNEPPQLPNVYSKTTSSFLSIPLMLRVNFGQGPVKFYANGGPKISLWMGGKGLIRDLDEFDEFLGTDYEYEYRYVFNESKETFPETGRADVAIVDPNRIQFALAAGVGAYFEIPNGSRIMLDLRYSHGHSNMGFNGSPGFTFEEYEENFEYANDMISVSVGYMLEFDQTLQIKGRSTNAQTNKSKKSKKKNRKKKN